MSPLSTAPLLKTWVPCVLAAAILRRGAASPSWDSGTGQHDTGTNSISEKQPQQQHMSFINTVLLLCTLLYHSELRGGIFAQKGFAHSTGIIFPGRKMATRAMQAEHHGNESQCLSNTAKLQTSNQANGGKGGRRSGKKRYATKS